MSTQTICVSSTPGDATAEAKRVAENIRATGKVVTIGEEYTQPLGHKAGMLAVDLTIEDPAPPETVFEFESRTLDFAQQPPDPKVVMATADGFDRETITVTHDTTQAVTTTPSLAEQYPSLITPPRPKTKAQP